VVVVAGSIVAEVADMELAVGICFADDRKVVDRHTFVGVEVVGRHGWVDVCQMHCICLAGCDYSTL
jgi:hypothetical protein